MQHLAERAVLRDQPRAVPHRIHERRQPPGLDEVRGGLRGESGREQQQQRAGDGEQVPRRDRREAAIDERTDRNATGEADHAAGRERMGVGAAGGDAVQEQHEFGALAQDRERDHEQQARQRRGAARDTPTDAGEIGGELATVALHPQAVPTEEGRGGEQHGRVEDFLATALEGVREPPGTECDQRGAGEAERDAAADPPAATGQVPGPGQQDADQQGGLEHLPQDDEGGANHGRATSQPRAVVGLKSPKYS